MSGDGATAPRFTAIASEVALALVSVSAVFGLARVFANGSFLPSLVTIGLAGHLSAALVRRSRLGTAATLAVGAASGFLVITWVRYPATTFLGIPSTESISLPWQDLRFGWQDFGDVIAPAPVTGGFVLASAIAIWLVAWAADWAAFRIGAMAEAVLPATAMFLFAGMLGAERHRVAASIGFAAAVLAFAVLHRTDRRSRSSAWIGDGRLAGTRSALGIGASLALLAVVLGAVGGTRLPGAGSDPLIDWRGERDRPATRITVSPLVDIRTRLVSQSNQTVFTVRSDQRAYWRLTSLDRFDGSVWSSEDTFSSVENELDGLVTGGPMTSITQQYEITGLAAIWLPAAFSPRRIETDGTEVRWDRESDTLIVDSSRETSDDITYEVVSTQPVLTPAMLDADTNDPPRSIEETYLDLPARFSPKVANLAEQIVGESTNAYTKALMLQNYFRENFEYDLEGTQAGHGEDAMEAFLDSYRGYCEQFAGTFAAMARHLGVPARVAVGFTPGEIDPLDTTKLVVRGKNAHAWPEVWIDEVGWVAFEPTPGRGMPGAETYTGVPEEQAGEDPTSVTVTTAPEATETTVAPGGTTVPASGQANPDDLETAAGATAAEDDGLSWPLRFLLVLLAVVLVLLAWVGVLALLRRWRRHRRRAAAVDSRQRIQVAWLEGADAVATVAPAAVPSETTYEYAERSEALVGAAAGPLHDLAGLASVASWSGAPTDGDDPLLAAAVEAEQLSGTVDRAIRLQLDRRQQVRRAFDPRAGRQSSVRRKRSRRR